MVHVLSWFVIFCHGSWCFVMVQYIPDNFKIGVVSLMSQLQLVWWFVMVRDVSSWFVMVHYRSSWFTWWFVMFLCYGSSWFMMFYCHGFVMVRHGLSWFVMVRHGSHDGSWCFSVMVSSWFVMVRDVLLSWFRHSLSWFVMFYSLKFSRKGSCDPLFSQSEFQIHYQISFLMRLLIFPFPFKEHTSKELCWKGHN